MRIFVLSAAALLIFAAAPTTCAASVSPGIYGEDIPDSDRLLEEQYEASGADSLYDALPDDVVYSLRRAGVDIRSGANGQSPDTEELFRSLRDTLSDAAGEPLKACLAMCAVIMICAITCGMTGQQGGAGVSETVGTVVTAASCCVVITPAALHIERCADALSGINTFAQAIIPVMCSFLLISGGGGAAALMTSAAGIFSLAADSGLLSLLRMYLALSCVSSVSGILKIDGLLAVVEKNIKWALTLAATVFLGLLSAFCASAAAADRLGYRTFRLIISGSVPIIGGIVGDALGSLKSCMLLLRSSVSGFGILAVSFMLIPPIVRTVLWRLSLELCAAAAGMFGVKSAEKLLACCAGVMDILLSFLVFTGVILLGTLACTAGGSL